MSRTAIGLVGVILWIYQTNLLSAAGPGGGGHSGGGRASGGSFSGGRAGGSMGRASGFSGGTSAARFSSSPRATGAGMGAGGGSRSGGSYTGASMGRASGFSGVPSAARYSSSPRATGAGMGVGGGSRSGGSYAGASTGRASGFSGGTPAARSTPGGYAAGTRSQGGSGSRSGSGHASTSTGRASGFSGGTSAARSGSSGHASGTRAGDGGGSRSSPFRNNSNPHPGSAQPDHFKLNEQNFRSSPSHISSSREWNGRDNSSNRYRHDRDWWQQHGHEPGWAGHGHDYDWDDWRRHGPVWWGGPWWFSWGFYADIWPYYYGYSRPDAVYAYYDLPPGQYAAAAYTAADPLAPADSPVVDAAADQASAGPGDESYYDGAVSAFRQGDYRSALRLASHAAIDWPQDPKPHELAALSLFALGNYSGAAMEAHAAAALGPISDWATVAGFYNNDVRKFTEHLRALEKSVDTRKTDPGSKFLLGYYYLVTNYRDEAQKQFGEVVKAVPQDKLAAELLERARGKTPAPPPRLESAKEL